MVGVDRGASPDPVEKPRYVAAPDRDELAVAPDGQHVFLQEPVDLVTGSERVAANALLHELLGDIGEGERTLGRLLPSPRALSLRIEPSGDLDQPSPRHLSRHRQIHRAYVSDGAPCRI